MAEEAGRPFGVWTAAALVVGSMIGAGVFALPAVVAPLGWTGVAAWLAAILGGLLLAIVLAQLTAHRPEETGLIAIIGSALGPLGGVICGWSFWISCWSANAIIALTAINYLGTFWPIFTASPAITALFATGAMWLLTLLNLQGATAAGRFQVTTAILKLLPLVAVVAIVAMLLARGGGQFTQHPHTPFSLAALTPAVGMVFLAMVGFETASAAAERVRDPARNVLRATIFGLALTGLLYMIIATGIAFALPESQVAASQAPVALFVEVFWGHEAALAVSAFAVIAALGCLNGWVLISGELPLGMARAGLLPRWMGATNSRGAPVTMILVSSGLTTLLILSTANQTAGALLDFMLRLTTSASMWVYLGGCIAALRLGVTRPVAALGAAFTLWTLAGAGLEALGLGVALIVSVVPLYYFALRRAPLAEQAT
jgi:APA family basic amino acid/polyamine antiporter